MCASAAKVISMEESDYVVDCNDESPQVTGSVTAFVCVNCARPALAPTSAGRPRPATPDFRWPISVQEVPVPCAGRLQPEHVLKAFESGADLVCMVACQGDNCHYVEGSERCARRADHIRAILDGTGLGGERLMLFRLPGTAAQDMALAAGGPALAYDSEGVEALVAGVRDQVVRVLLETPPSPLRATDGDSYQEVETIDDDSEEYARQDADLQPAGHNG
jgi:coenzyme F420-reducing hydrogenase delta subunit